MVKQMEKRHSIKFKSIKGEKLSADENSASLWIKEEFTKIKEEHSISDIFNADETGLYYKMLPNKTFCLGNEKVSGFKVRKERVSVLLCANALGTEKIIPLVIGRFANPRCFKTCKELQCDYESNSSAWMTRAIFQNWLAKWNNKLRKSKRRICLIIDNCTSHLKIPDMSNIQLKYFPKNTTAILQPMDQGIIAAFKCHYRSTLAVKMSLSVESRISSSLELILRNGIS